MLRDLIRWGGLLVLSATPLLWIVTGLAMWPLVLGQPWHRYVMMAGLILMPVGHLLATRRAGLLRVCVSVLAFATVQLGLLSILNRWL